MLAWLIFLVCRLFQLSLSGHEVMYGTSPQSAYHIIQERETPFFRSLPGDWEGKTDQRQHFINHEISFRVLDGIHSHPCAQGSWSHSEISEGSFIEYSQYTEAVQGAEDIKYKRKDTRCSQSSRVSRPADSAPSIDLPPFSIYLFIKWVKISLIILFTFKKNTCQVPLSKHTYIILGIRIWNNISFFMLLCYS